MSARRRPGHLLRKTSSAAAANWTGLPPRSVRPGARSLPRRRSPPFRHSLSLSTGITRASLTWQHQGMGWESAFFSTTSSTTHALRSFIAPRHIHKATGPPAKQQDNPTNETERVEGRRGSSEALAPPRHVPLQILLQTPRQAPHETGSLLPEPAPSAGQAARDDESCVLLLLLHLPLISLVRSVRVARCEVAKCSFKTLRVRGLSCWPRRGPCGDERSSSARWRPTGCCWLPEQEE